MKQDNYHNDGINAMSTFILTFFVFLLGVAFTKGQNWIIEIPIKDDLNTKILGWFMALFSAYILLATLYAVIRTVIKDRKKRPVNTKLVNPFRCFNAKHFKKGV